MKALLLFLLLMPAAEAQNRHLAKPWTWMKSNANEAEYQAWVEPRRHDNPFKSKVFWTGVLIINEAKYN